MADESATAAPPTVPDTLPTPMELDKPESNVKLVDDAPQEAVPVVEDSADPAKKPEDAPKVNGDAELEPTDMGGKPSTSAEADAGATEPTAETPAAKKAAANGGSSKKKSAVPEHKSKKLNKKKSRPLTNLEAQPGEYYFARMKGHPPWPSVVCDEEMLPHSLLTSRPVTARLPDGTFRKPEYADGGKRAHERTFPIMFLHTNEFAWMPNTELTPLDPEDESVKSPPEKGKSKTLLAAYAKATEANDLHHFKTMLTEHQKALQQDIEEREALAAEKAAAKSKKSRKSSGAVADDGDEMDVDDDEAAEKPKSKKRKKADDSDADEKPAKTPKTGAKLKLTTPKAPPAEASAKKKSASKSKAKATKSSSEDDTATPKVEEKPVTPEQAREIKERKVLYYRHKLQRGLLSRDIAPKEDEMKPMSEFLSELEEYPDLEGSIIRVTKIHKVLKQILKLNSIPLEEEFHFKDRSRDLLAKWNETLANDPTGAGDKEDAKEAEEPKTPGAPAAAPAAATETTTTTNGEKSQPTENGNKETEKVEEAAAPETESAEKLENKIGTSTEGAKEADVPKAEEKAQDKTESAEEKKDDGPAVNTAPEAGFQPAPEGETATEETAA